MATMEKSGQCCKTCCDAGKGAEYMWDDQSRLASFRLQNRILAEKGYKMLLFRQQSASMNLSDKEIVSGGSRKERSNPIPGGVCYEKNGF
jgi:hypothetical protein